MHHRSKMLH
uniref:Uncharacterized protein n=1 Tax=Rhizophora mucronata TaxID=61149 RepID=A0A2P2Q3F0_RHIMU